jgi:PTH1 family peptidyl-tRNA hydrolase
MLKDISMKKVSTPNMIIGLGNPEEEYKDTRHNLGYMVLDSLNSKKEKWHKGEHNLWCLNKYLNAVMLKPTTGMNSSGLCAKDALETIQGDITHIIVIYDDMDFEPGQVRVKVGGSSGKHNGVQSIINKIGKDFTRVRVGIGKPKSKKDGIDFVLGRFSGKDRKLIDNAIQVAAEAVTWVIKDGAQKAMNKYNRREEK